MCSHHHCYQSSTTNVHHSAYSGAIGYPSSSSIHLTSELDQLNGDIVLLQECDENIQKDFVPFMEKHKYDFKYMKKSSYSNTEEPKTNGVMTMWDTSKFKYIEHHNVSFNLNLENSLKNKYSVHSKDEVGLIVILQSLTNSRYIVVTNTHLLFSTNNGMAKLAQLDMMLLHLTHIKRYRCIFLTLSLRKSIHKSALLWAETLMLHLAHFHMR
jgi:mRNA deadenylase 3'-5' endonuclease subunit Ccr4